MLPLFFTAVSLFTLLNAVLALRPDAARALATTEQWSVPRLDMKMMTRFTGLPGQNPWPESIKFPSTIDFDINMPGDQKAYCLAEWANGTLPDDLRSCEGGESEIGFRMKDYTDLGPRRRELSFILQVFRVDRLP